MLLAKLNKKLAENAPPKRSLRKLRDEAEDLAERYKRAGEEKKKWEQEQAQLRDALLELMGSEFADATPNGKTFTAHTVNVVVTNRRRAPKVDVNLMRKLIDKKLFASLVTVSTDFVVDNDALADAVRKGRISKAKAKRFITEGESAGTVLSISDITSDQS